MVLIYPGGSNVPGPPGPQGAQGVQGVQGPAGPAGAAGPLISFPSSASFVLGVGLAAASGGTPQGSTAAPVVYPGVGQLSLTGFWTPYPSNGGQGNLSPVAVEINAAKAWQYFEAGFFDDAIGANQQYLTFGTTVPLGFTTFSGPFEWSYRFNAQVGAAPLVTVTFTLEVFDPNTGAVAATATRVLGEGGPFDANYVTLSIPAVTLNAVPFVAGDLLRFRAYAAVTAGIGPGTIRHIRFSKLSIPWS